MGIPKSNGGLGFRSLVDFNMALLGKHCWSIINNPQSLVARVFKARYFHEAHLLNAKRGGGSSYIWSGIWEAKEVLCQGFRWIGGDEESICAHKDPWLRGKHNFRVENHHLQEAKTEKVSQYFRPSTKEWDEVHIRQAFTSIDVEAVLKVRIPQNNVKDRLTWTASNDGFYTLKSGYDFLRSRWSSNDLSLIHRGGKSYGG